MAVRKSEEKNIRKLCKIGKQSIGIKSYFYDSEKKDLESLKKFLVDNL
jgi:hypothetical protein